MSPTDDGLDWKIQCMLRFPKTARILRADDFLRVKREGRSARSGPVTVAVLVSEKRRLGIVVSRRVGNAVQRNRIKRVVREYFRLHRDEFPHGDSVVVVGTGCAALKNDDIRSRLAQALTKLRTAIGR